MKSRFLALVFGVWCLVFCAGCVNLVVPRTTISGSLGGKPFCVSAPKDIALEHLVITSATNGTISITVSNLTAKMNPEVITTTADSQVKLIQAIGSEIRSTAASAK